METVENVDKMEVDSDSDFSDESDSSFGSSNSSISCTNSSSSDSLIQHVDICDFEEVPDPFPDYCPGPNASELEDKVLEKYFELSQIKLRAWDQDPDDKQKRAEYFSTVHDLMMLPAFVRMQHNPYTFDWNGARRAEDRLSYDTVSQAFYVTHLQLSKLSHNVVPHYLQMLTLTPSKTEMWYELGEKAVKLGDWKNAEFAYRKFIQFKGDQTKGMQNIVLLHFVSGDFLRTISALKELLTQQPTNTVGHIIANELQKIEGPWAEHIDQVIKQAGIMKPRIQLGQDRVEWILEKIEKFRKERKPKCNQCTHEGKLLAQSAHYLDLEKQDDLFYHFGKRLLQFYEDFSKEPNAFVFIKFPMRENDKILNEIMMKTNSTVLASANENPDDDQVQVLDVLVNKPLKNKGKKTAMRQTLFAPNPTLNHLQITNFFKQFADLNESERWKNLYGWKGITSIFDQLLSFVVANCSPLHFKHLKDDFQVFGRIYHQWCELIEHKCDFQSPKFEAIHVFANEIGCENAVHKLDKVAHELFKLISDQVPLVTQPTTSATLFNMDIDVDAERQLHAGSPVFDSVLQMYEQLKQKRRAADEPMDVQPSTSQDPESNCNFPRLLTLYLNKDSASDFNVPDHMVQMQLDSTISVFPTVGLATMSTAKLALLVFYHIKEAKENRCLKREQALVNIDKLKEYNHLLSVFKIADMHLSSNEDFQTTVKKPKELETNFEITRLLEEIKLDFFKLDSHSRRIAELLKGFKRDLIDNCVIQLKQGGALDVDEELLAMLRNCNDLDGDTKELLERHFALYELAKNRSDFIQMQDTLALILNTLLENSEEREEFLLEQLDKTLNEIDFHLAKSSDIAWSEFDATLKELIGKSFYRTFVHLWMTHYKVACRLDPTTSEEFIALYNRTETTDQQRLPTESLTVLKKAHTVFGEEKCCMGDGGQFLQFYLDELLSSINSGAVQEALDDSDVYDEDIYRSVKKEICQTINCLYKLELPARFVKVHEYQDPEPTFMQLNWDLCEKILPFFMPDTLPTISDKDTLSSELIELLQKLQTLVEEPLTAQLKDEFGRFTESNKDFRPLCRFDAENGAVEINSVHNDVDLLAWPSTSDLRLSRRKLSAQILYLLTFREFKLSLKSGETGGTKIQSLAKNTLLFGSDVLSADQLATLWMILAIKMNYILEKPELDLFKQMGYLFFPSYMAILMVKTLAETHLDLGTAFYKAITRFKRYLANKSNTELRTEIEATIYELMPKSNVHLQLAFMFRNDNVEIGWSSKYYLGKIAEKLNTPLLEVMEHYQMTAQLMEENFDFLKKVSKSDQEDFEPLELYYCIHSFLSKRRLRAFNEQNIYELRKVVKCLELFAAKNISKKSEEKTPNFSIDLRNEFNEVEKATTEELSDSPNVDVLLSPNSLHKSNLLRKYNSEAEQLCSHAFEKLVSLFPHYKAAYRLAKHLFDYGQHKEAADFLFQNLFLIKSEINEQQQMFKGFVVIENPSFYYSGVLDYHMQKIILLLSDCLEKTSDMKRIAYVFCNVLRLYKKPKRICSTDSLHAMINRIKLVFGQLIKSAFMGGQPLSSVENPLYTSRLILYEIDKLLRGTQFDFADGFHQVVMILQQQLNAANAMNVQNVQPTA